MVRGAAGGGFSSDGARDRDVAGEFSLLGCDVATVEQFFQDLFGRRGEESRGDFRAGNFRDDFVGAHDISGFVAVNAVEAVLDDCRREGQVG